MKYFLEYAIKNNSITTTTTMVIAMLLLHQHYCRFPHAAAAAAASRTGKTMGMAFVARYASFARPSSRPRINDAQVQQQQQQQQHRFLKLPQSRIALLTPSPSLTAPLRSFASTVTIDPLPQANTTNGAALRIDGAEWTTATSVRERHEPLPPSTLRWKCDPSIFDFKTTADLIEATGAALEQESLPLTNETTIMTRTASPNGKRLLLGQERAESAIQMGIHMPSDGYNLFVLGRAGSGKRTVVKRYLEKVSASDPKASDWVYVYNWDRPDAPKALALPAGNGQLLKKDMENLIEDVKVALSAALDDEEFHRTRQQAEREIYEEYERDMKAVAEKAKERGLFLIRNNAGHVFLAGSIPDDENPMKKYLPPESSSDAESPKAATDSTEDKKRSSTEKEAEVTAAIEALEPELQKALRSFPVLRKRAMQRTRELAREASQKAIQPHFRLLKDRYKDLHDVVSHLECVEARIVDRAEDIHKQMKSEEGGDGDAIMNILQQQKHKPVNMDHYKVNLLVDNSETNGAPVVYEDHPSYHDLFGRMEHVGMFGSYTTDFSLIKPGSLHRANGGYLVVQARDLLMQPFSWEALKRSLRHRRVKMDNLGNEYGLIPTVTLQPEPIPLQVKVVLLGDRMLYYLLQQYDPDFSELFKVAADFSDEMDRSKETCREYARMLAALIETEGLRPMDPSAVCAMLEQAARSVGDQEKLSTHVRSCADLARESDYWASSDKNSTVIRSEHVQRAIDQQVYRSDRIRDLLYEQIRRGVKLVDVQGSAVGQVNGLSVLSLDSFSFGQPSRITASARMGGGGGKAGGSVVDIEREVELGGPTHSKGVMILSSFLASHYASDCPMCLSANLAFEQSYGQVEGDSASMAELCALLSTLSGIPIKQSLAITGSVNQLGQAQAIGGATQKIEGFYDICRAKGLTGDQGVLIPTSNQAHLMLRPDVVDAVERGQFHVYTYKDVNDAIEILTGVEAGIRSDNDDTTGIGYPVGSVNYLVDERLHEWANKTREFAATSKDNDKSETDAPEDAK